jgi:transcriptional regulator with XRE-family HTH domain
MTHHAAVGETAAQRLAGEVRAEMARQKRTAGEMAQALGITAHTAGRRLSGAVPFNVTELDAVARWLGVELEQLLQKSPRESKAMAS